MRIGYPCINLSLECRGTKTFRLRSYSPERFQETLANNLACLEKTIEWNIKHHLLFFRISSDLVPFASHPVCKFPWQKVFQREFRIIGRLIKRAQMRISMHPDQFVLLNALDERVVRDSVRELKYHSEILDLLSLPSNAKVQIHIGGVYGNKDKSVARFIRRYEKLPEAIKRRLVIENDDRLYNVSDCLKISKETGIPVLFDSFHHEVNPNGDDLRTAFEKCALTWRKRDGLPMVDYSSQKPSSRFGSHSEHINPFHFRQFLFQLAGYQFDLMLEIKDKEKSALTALKIYQSLKGNINNFMSNTPTLLVKGKVKKIKRV
ncbi:MAG: UV DNA damage repair endonuclease UvsE [candidate division WOR-3 bacterium]